MIYIHILQYNKLFIYIYILIYFIDSIDSIPQPTVNDGNILNPKQLIELPYQFEK